VTKPQETERMEAPMKRCHFIGVDSHCPFCEIAVVDSRGGVIQRNRCDTAIPAVLQVIEPCRGPDGW
jgi:hypothetical protein